MSLSTKVRMSAHLSKRIFIIGHDDPTVEAIFRVREWRVIKNPFYEDFDLMVFTGGSDLHPKLYNQANNRSHPNPSRDVFEVGMYKIFENKKKLGICRGGQLL